MICTKCSVELPEGANFCSACGKKIAVTTKKTRTRGNGMGTVYQLPNKTWAAERTLGYEVDGHGNVRRRVVRKKGFKTKKDALMYLPQLQEVQNKYKRLTFSQVYDAWEPTHRAGKSTMDCYRAAYKYFRPLWLQVFSEIDIDDLQECMDECSKGKRTRENMKALCGLLYKYAIPRHLAPMNLAQYLIVGAGSHGVHPAISKEDLEKLEKAVGTVPYANYVVAQCYLGFRPSELLALDVSKYDRKERLFIGGAKTDAGKDRTVPVSKKIQHIIDQLVQDRVAGPVFCGPNGEPMEITEYRSRFYQALEQAGINNPMEGEGDMRRHKYTPHSCRHTFATLMKSASGSDKDKLALIGHTSTEMLRHYQDADIASLRAIVDAL